MKYGLIANGRVNNIIPEFVPEFPNIPIKERYHPDFLARYIAIPDDVPVEIGWSYDPDTETFHEPIAPPESPPITMPDYTEFIAGLMEGYTYDR